MNAIEDQLKKLGIQTLRIEGGQNQFVRDQIINAFQHNNTHVVLCMIQAGGLGVSLHDLYGRPRISLISPPQSSNDLKQVLGRIHRAGSKSKAIQKLIYVAGTVEEGTCNSVRKKLTNLGTLVDGDLSTGAGF
jgi:superfamily II DNA or RNA helicase